MTIAKPVADALNAQIHEELFSSHLYLGMACQCETRDLPGFAHWFRIQSDEERAHGMRIVRWLTDCGEPVKLDALQQPPGYYTDVSHIAADALRHEEHITKRIKEVYEIAGKHGEYATQVMLHWFLTEQVEEEKTARAVVADLNRVKDDPAGLLALDRLLGQRTPEA